MIADGSDQARLTDNPAMDRNPHWSLNGEKIIFQSNRDGSRGIYIMNIDGSDQRRLADNLAGPSISLSADGSRIAFASQEDDQMDNFTVEVDGSILTRLTNQPGDDRIQSGLLMGK